MNCVLFLLGVILLSTFLCDTIDRPMGRILATLYTFCMFMVAAFAQQHVVELRTSDGSTVARQKLVYATISAFDEQAIVSFHEDRLKVKIDVLVQGRVLAESLAQNGVGDFVCVRCGDKMAKVALELKAAAPVWNGDPATEMQHAAAKQQWASENPDAHQSYVRSLRDEIPVNHD